MRKRPISFERDVDGDARRDLAYDQTRADARPLQGERTLLKRRIPMHAGIAAIGRDGAEQTHALQRRRNFEFGFGAINQYAQAIRRGRVDSVLGHHHDTVDLRGIIRADQYAVLREGDERRA